MKFLMILGVSAFLWMAGCGDEETSGGEGDNAENNAGNNGVNAGNNGVNAGNNGVNAGNNGANAENNRANAENSGANAENNGPLNNSFNNFEDDNSAFRHDEGDFILDNRLLEDGDDPELHQYFRDMQILELEVSLLNSAMKLPYDFVIVGSSCLGLEDITYEQDRNTIFPCYSLLGYLSRVVYQDQVGISLESLTSFLFAFYHQVGHAVLYAYETSEVDERVAYHFATWFAIETAQPSIAFNGARWLYEGRNEEVFVQDHGLDEQTYLEILCILYGSDPASFSASTAEAGLPADRAQECPGEYQSFNDAWYGRLMSWLYL